MADLRMIAKKLGMEGTDSRVSEEVDGEWDMTIGKCVTALQCLAPGDSYSVVIAGEADGTEATMMMGAMKPSTAAQFIISLFRALPEEDRGEVFMELIKHVKIAHSGGEEQIH
jgi:hypothetical protein